MEIYTRTINLLKIPISIFDDENLELYIEATLNKNTKNQFAFLSFEGFMKALFNKEYRQTLSNCSLVIPTSKTLCKASRFLYNETPRRYIPFNFMIKFLNVLERKSNSIYMIGGSSRNIIKATTNIRTSFPEMKIVGKYKGKMNKQEEINVVLAVKKASPSLVFVGSGVKKKDTWISTNIGNLNKGIYIYSDETFKIIIGKKRPYSEKKWEKGLQNFPANLFKPWKIFKPFVFLSFWILVLFEKLKIKRTRK